MKFVYIILIFISLATGELEILNNIDNEYPDVNINDIVDHSVPTISQFIINNGLDPLHLPQMEKKLWMAHSNITNSIEIVLEPMIYKADLILHSGILRYLSNLKRYGNAILNYKDRILKMDVGFEFIFLKGTYDFTINMVFLNLKGRILVSVANVHAKTIVTFNTMNYTLSLDKFELVKVPSVRVIIENKNGLVDWMNTFIISIITPFFQNTITNVVEKEATNAIQAFLDKINNRINH